ncbi:hypothetical protein PLESTB_001265400 [Pleodorina starrii]|uniref:3-hydroxyisobutyryl-CoA hydrolase n=1 Tax=Pleodorina starrii TaxID=330485 RepID=A0A9W6BTN5_9CHLO|nr:hypothetical protein PLESTM_000714500 [Pleodorina starrii]GLC57775.1 hypothetical protein PLESTB_001265400 [Pleodorina starrii]GLC65153.1 hypothetical protein PLESTF_000257900 [Pleodorina starrii]
MRATSIKKAVARSLYCVATRRCRCPSHRPRTTSAMADGKAEEPEVLLDVKGSVAFVTLNRPRALNSLSLGMVTRLLALNLEFSKPGSPVACVVVRGAGGKAFCAGGDVKEVVLRARSGDCSHGSDFFRIEYVNNAAIAQLPVPYIAIIDGIVMGGGVGVSYHGHFRVATERTVLAMPESGIGLFPDVGASFFLHRLPGHLGRYMGLTGQRLSGAEVKDAGFATHLIPSSRLPDLEAAITQLGPRAADPAQLDALLRSLEQTQPPAPAAGTAAGGGGGGGGGGDVSALLSWKLPLINAHFGLGSVAEVVASLEAAVEAADRQAAAAGGGGGGGGRGDEARVFLKDTLAAMRKGSPLSHVATWEMLRRSAAGHMTLRQCLQMEFELAARFVAGQADFLEGVRALLIDKDNRPKWRYGTAREVPEHVVQQLFEPVADEPPLFGAGAALAAAAAPPVVSRM